MRDRPISMVAQKILQDVEAENPFVGRIDQDRLKRVAFYIKEIIQTDFRLVVKYDKEINKLELIIQLLSEEKPIFVRFKTDEHVKKIKEFAKLDYITVRFAEQKDGLTSESN